MKIISWNCNCKFREKYKQIQKYDKGYHIDHCFVSPKMLKDYRILNNDNWLEFSIMLVI